MVDYAVDEFELNVRFVRGGGIVHTYSENDIPLF